MEPPAPPPQQQKPMIYLGKIVDFTIHIDSWNGNIIVVVLDDGSKVAIGNFPKIYTGLHLYNDNGQYALSCCAPEKKK